MNLRGVLAVAVLALPAAARAQVAAMPEDPPRVPPRGSEHVGIGAQLAFGTTGDGGFAGRLEYLLTPYLAKPGRFGGLFGFAIGYEYWRVGPGTWGMDLPFELVIGMRGTPVRAQVGAGVDAFLLDRWSGDTGVGFYAPTANASIGFDIAPVTLMADARVTRRWLIGADDHTQWLFTVGLGGTMEGPTLPPSKARRVARP